MGWKKLCCFVRRAAEEVIEDLITEERWSVAREKLIKLVQGATERDSEFANNLFRLAKTFLEDARAGRLDASGFLRAAHFFASAETAAKENGLQDLATRSAFYEGLSTIYQERTTEADTVAYGTRRCEQAIAAGSSEDKEFGDEAAKELVRALKSAGDGKRAVDLAKRYRVRDEDEPSSENLVWKPSDAGDAA